MTRVALACSEPLRRRMAGIGIRYAEMAGALTRAGLEVVLLTAGESADAEALNLPVSDVRPLLRRGHKHWADCSAIVVQGRAATPLLAAAGSRPVVVDLYDPWLVENLHYWSSLRYRAYRSDVKAWKKQMARGDLFLASCEQQRLYYLGMLTAMGRVDPPAISADPDLQHLVITAPFGLPGELPAHRSVLAEKTSTARILFGCLYDWLDPWPLLHALEARTDEAWELLFVATPNEASTPQAQLQRVREWCRHRGWWGEKVRLIEWVAAARRFDLFRDVDVMVVADRPGLEARLGLRTRVLEAAAAGCPIVVTDGGATAELVRNYELGSVVAPADSEAVARAIDASLGGEAGQRQAGAQRLRHELRWDSVLDPLIRFLHEPADHGRRRSTKWRFRARSAGAIEEG